MEADGIGQQELIGKLRCKRLVKGRCSIYDRRPIICRLFGASEDPNFQCPHGRMAETPLSIDETREIMVQWLSLITDEGIG